MNLAGLRRLLGKIGFLPENPANTALTTVGAGTWTAAAMVGGVITRSGPTAAFTDTTTTATLLEAGMPTPLVIGTSWVITYRNTTAFIATVAGGTGVTASGTLTVQPLHTAQFLVTYTATNTFTIVGLASTAAAAANGAEVVTAANVITADENNKTFYLDAAAGFLSTLPAPFLGAKYTFIVKTATSSNGYTIGTPTADIIFGSSVERAGTAGVAGASEDLITLVNGQMVVGDRVDLESDGTNWYARAQTDIAAGITFTVT